MASAVAVSEQDQIGAGEAAAAARGKTSHVERDADALLQWLRRKGGRVHPAVRFVRGVYIRIWRQEGGEKGEERGGSEEAVYQRNAILTRTLLLITCCVRCFTDAQMGLGGFARESIGRDAVVASVPVQACVTTQVARSAIVEGLLGLQQGQQASSSAMPLPSDKDWIILYIVLHKLLLLRQTQKRRGSTQEREPQECHNQAERGVEETYEPKAKRQKHFADLASSASTKWPVTLQHINYVALLPEETLTPLHYNRAELRLLESTPLYAHAARRHRQTRENCLTAASWLTPHLAERTEEWAVTIRENLSSGQGFGLEGPPSAQMDLDAEGISQEIDRWHVDEEAWSFLSVWRWAETIHGRYVVHVNMHRGTKL